LLSHSGEHLIAEAVGADRPRMPACRNDEILSVFNARTLRSRFEHGRT
jgi:hypothetical protein